MNDDDYIIVAKDIEHVSIIYNSILTVYDIIYSCYRIISSTYRYTSNISVMYLLICLYSNPTTYTFISMMGHGPFLITYIIVFKIMGWL